MKSKPISKKHLKARSYPPGKGKYEKPRTADSASALRGFFHTRLRFISGGLLTAGTVQHNINNLTIRLPHAIFGQNSNVTNGGVHTFCHNTIAAKKLLLILVHVVTKNAGINRRGDFGRTRRLCAVATIPDVIASALTIVCAISS